MPGSEPGSKTFEQNEFRGFFSFFVPCRKKKNFQRWEINLSKSWLVDLPPGTICLLVRLLTSKTLVHGRHIHLKLQFLESMSIIIIDVCFNAVPCCFGRNSSSSFIKLFPKSNEAPSVGKCQHWSRIWPVVFSLERKHFQLAKTT